MLFHHINFISNFIRNDFVYPDIATADQSPVQYRPKEWITDFPDVHWAIWKIQPQEIFTEEFFKWMRGLKLIPLHVLLFYAPPESRLVTHVDGGGADAWAFNWASNENVKMSWYTTINETGKERAVSDADCISEISNTFIKSPTLVKIGIAHGAKNLSLSPAWVTSLRFKTNLTFDEIKTVL